MTQIGFAGNLRYVALPAAVVCVLAGAGWVDAERWLRRRAGVAAAVAGAVAVTAFWLVAAAEDWRSLEWSWGQVTKEATLYDDLPNAIAAAGGADAIKRCGSVYTGPFDTLNAAWELRLHADQVRNFPFGPGTILAGRTTWLAHDPRYAQVAETAQWNVERACGRGYP
jgi:hypothetical protein